MIKNGKMASEIQDSEQKPMLAEGKAEWQSWTQVAAWMSPRPTFTRKSVWTSKLRLDSDCKFALRCRSSMVETSVF